jgi:lipopolysaccharide export system permease protein
MAILVGSSLIVSLLAVEGELIGMRACGIPAPRAMLPVLVISVLFAPMYFALNNVLLPYTNALADKIKHAEITDSASGRDASVGKMDWFRSGQQVIEAERIDMELGEAQSITIYEIGDDGLPVSRTDARGARHIGHGEWRLDDPARMEVVGPVAILVEAPSFMQLGEELSTEVDTMHYSVAELAREADEIEAAGYDASILRTDYHVKLAEPLACIVLPAVVMFFAVGGPPFPGPAQTLFVSGIVGVSYILLTGVAASLGHGKVVPPVVGGWSPTLVYALLAGIFGLRLWRRM